MDEKLLKRAATAAVASGGADAVILFGSRALGTARPDSDWDVCIVGGHDKEHAARALLAAEPALDPWSLDVLWTQAPQPLQDATEATVWADIVRYGQVLGGDRDMLASVNVKPFDIDSLGTQMGIAVVMIAGGARASAQHRQARGNESTRKAHAVRASLESTHAAEALTIVFCALADTKHTGRHVVKDNADLMRKRANSLEDAGDRAAVLRMAECASAMNGGTKDTHGVAYSLNVEPEESWLNRLFWAMRSHGELTLGVLAGTGPMAALAGHERAAELSGVMRESATAAADAAGELIDRFGPALPDLLKEGVSEWRKRSRDALESGHAPARESSGEQRPPESE